MDIPYSVEFTKKGELYMKIIVKVNGKDIKEMTAEEKIEVANALNKQALLTSGYKEVKSKERAS